MNTVTLSTGRTIPLADVTLDVASQQFFYGAANVTAFLSGAQKRQFRGYDVARANVEASDAARLSLGESPYVNGSEYPYTDAALETIRGIGSDIATAAQGVRDFAGIGPENAGKRSPLFWTVLVLGTVWLAHQLGLFAWVRKKLA